MIYNIRLDHQIIVIFSAGEEMFLLKSVTDFNVSGCFLLTVCEDESDTCTLALLMIVSAGGKTDPSVHIHCMCKYKRCSWLLNS